MRMLNEFLSPSPLSPIWFVGLMYKCPFQFSFCPCVQAWMHTTKQASTSCACAHIQIDQCTQHSKYASFFALHLPKCSWIIRKNNWEGGTHTCDFENLMPPWKGNGSSCEREAEGKEMSRTLYVKAWRGDHGEGWRRGGQASLRAGGGAGAEGGDGGSSHGDHARSFGLQWQMDIVLPPLRGWHAPHSVPLETGTSFVDSGTGLFHPRVRTSTICAQNWCPTQMGIFRHQIGRH